jgi:hypothetical protein
VGQLHACLPHGAPEQFFVMQIMRIVCAFCAGLCGGNILPHGSILTAVSIRLLYFGFFPFVR